MSSRLKGKVAVVTGAGSSGPGVGVGKAISILFAREGGQVVLVDRNEDAVRETFDTIATEGGDASIFVGDVTKAADCKAAIDFTTNRYGRLTTLVNNAAIFTPGAGVSNCDEADWDRVLDVNLKSAMLMTKYSVGKMLDNGSGSIVNVGSTAALRGSPTTTAYTASKAGIVGLTTLWAVEQGRKNIRVNCICPGTIYTPMVRGAKDISEKDRLMRARITPLGIEGTAWDIGWAAVFLACDESRWISGVTIPVDGGYVASSPHWGMFVAAED